MAHQIPSGTGQRENSDQIPDVSATQKTLCHQATTEFVAYVHNISPLKKGSYFDCQLQGKEKTFRGVCFSPTKLTRFTSLSQANSPVKIKKFGIDTKSNAEDLPMGHEVTIGHFPAIDFDKVKLPTSCFLSVLLQVQEKVDPSPEHAYIECAKCHFKQKQTASKAHWFAQVLFQDTNDGKIDLTLFEDAIHQIAKLTSDTVEVKGLTQADIESILVTSPPICITYN